MTPVSSRSLPAPEVERTILSSIGTSHDHDGVVFAIIQTEVAYRRLELVRVLGKPFGKVDRGGEHRLNESNADVSV
jgi:hypothetical protein